MTAWYNDNDPSAAAWLTNLAAAEVIAPGRIDDRPIQEMQADDLAGFTQCHFFAGIGGWPHALDLAGWPRTRAVWTASCPCQPLSSAGQRQGAADERHLWPALFGLIAELRPAVVFGEQVASPLGREWFAGVRLDLEYLGYACGAADLSAAGVGAPHIRQRIYFAAYRLADSEGGASGSGHDLPEGQPDTGPSGGLGDTHTDGPRPGAQRGVDSSELRDGRGGGVGQAWLGSGDAGSDGGVADTDGVHGGPGAGGGDGPQVGDGGSDGGLGNADRGRREGRPTGSKWGAQPAQGSGAWGVSEWIACRDGKARRAEPRVFPLADGVPGRVERLCRFCIDRTGTWADLWLPVDDDEYEGMEACETCQRVTPHVEVVHEPPSRVALLRGYGNAIVPPLAARFIQAVEAARA